MEWTSSVCPYCGAKAGGWVCGGGVNAGLQIAGRDWTWDALERRFRKEAHQISGECRRWEFDECCACGRKVWEDHVSPEKTYAKPPLKAGAWRPPKGEAHG